MMSTSSKIQRTGSGHLRDALVCAQEDDAHRTRRAQQAAKHLGEDTGAEVPLEVCPDDGAGVYSYANHAVGREATGDLPCVEDVGELRLAVPRPLIVGGTGVEIIEADAVGRSEKKLAHRRKVHHAGWPAGASGRLKRRYQQLRQEKVAQMIDPELNSGL